MNALALKKFFSPLKRDIALKLKEPRYQILTIAYGLLWVVLGVCVGIELLLSDFVWTTFRISFYASLLEDLIFFGALGFIVILISTGKPSEDTLENRIQYLANNKDNCPDSISDLQNTIRNFLCYNPKAKIDIALRSQTEEKLDVTMSFDTTIRNMCRDISFKNPIAVEATPTLKGDNGTWGGITLAKILDENCDDGEVNLCPSDIDLTENETYRKEIDHEIKQNSEIKFSASFRIFVEEIEKISETEVSEDSHSIYTFLDKFSKELTIKVMNQEKDKILNIRFDDNFKQYIDGDPTEEISANSEKVFKARCVPGNTKIYLSCKYKDFVPEPVTK